MHKKFESSIHTKTDASKLLEYLLDSKLYTNHRIIETPSDVAVEFITENEAFSEKFFLIKNFPSLSLMKRH